VGFERATTRLSPVSQTVQVILVSVGYPPADGRVVISDLSQLIGSVLVFPALKALRLRPRQSPL